MPARNNPPIARTLRHSLRIRPKLPLPDESIDGQPASPPCQADLQPVSAWRPPARGDRSPGAAETFSQSLIGPHDPGLEPISAKLANSREPSRSTGSRSEKNKAPQTRGAQNSRGCREREGLGADLTAERPDR